MQGKSTLIGTLSKGELDDGRGSARKLIFRHAHEQETGRTSAIASQYLGFDEGGQQVLTKKLGRLAPWQELAKSSTRTLQLIDLAGHEKYLKTTIFGLTGMMPDLGVVIVGANMGVKRMTKEHFGVSSALEIPVVVAVTKIDLCPKNILKETMQNIRKYLKNAGKTPLVVKSVEEAEIAAKTMKAEKLVSGASEPQVK